MAIEDIENARM